MLRVHPLDHWAGSFRFFFVIFKLEVFSLVVQGSAFGPLDQVLFFFSFFLFFFSFFFLGWSFSLDLFRVHPFSPTYGPGPRVGTWHISASLFGGGGGVGRIDCGDTNSSCCIM